MALSSSWIGIHFMPTPWPKAVHKVSTPISCRCGSTDTAITTMSVSLALKTRALLPSISASRACTNIRVSASSCRHGDTDSNDFWLSLQMMHPSFVTRIVLVVCVWQILSARNWNNSVLLSSSLRKLLKFVGVLYVPVTLLRMLCPRITLASPFTVDFLYTTSRTTSTLLYVAPLNWILGRMSSRA